MRHYQTSQKRANEDDDSPAPKRQKTEVNKENSTLKTVILQGFPKFLMDWDVKTPEKLDTSVPLEIAAVNQLLSEYPSAKCTNACIKTSGSSRNFAHVTFSSDDDLLKFLTAAQNHQLKAGDKILTATLFPDDWTLIEQLDDNSLLKIFSMLEPEDKLNAEKVCKRWESLALRSWCSQKKINVIYRQKSRDRAEEYLTRGSCYIEDLRMSMIPGDGCLIMENCTNIVKLSFTANDLLTGDIDTNEMCLMLESLKKLKSLEMTNISADFQYDIMSILPQTMEEIRMGTGYFGSKGTLWEQDISKFKNLHTLQINGLVMETNALKGLENLENLKHLDFKFSYPPANVLSSIRKFSKLEYLSIATGDIRDDVLIDIINNNQLLEYLDISYSLTPLKDATFRLISTLPNLKHLFIKQSPNVTLKLMDKMPKLEQLDCRYCPRVRNKPLLKILKTSPQLFHLNVVNCSINQAFFKKAAVIVEKRELSIVTNRIVRNRDELVLDIVESSGNRSDDSDDSDSRGDHHRFMRRFRNRESDESSDSEGERSNSDTETDDSSNSGESSDNSHSEDSDEEEVAEHFLIMTFMMAWFLGRH